MLPPPPPFGPAAYAPYAPPQLVAAPRPTFAYPPVFYWPYPSPPVSPTSYYHLQPQVATQGPQGTLVIMQGLPYSANTPDILNFFRGFPEVRGGAPHKQKQITA